MGTAVPRYVPHLASSGPTVVEVVCHATAVAGVPAIRRVGALSCGYNLLDGLAGLHYTPTIQPYRNGNGSTLEQGGCNRWGGVPGSWWWAPMRSAWSCAPRACRPVVRP